MIKNIQSYRRSYDKSKIVFFTADNRQIYFYNFEYPIWGVNMENEVQMQQYEMQLLDSISKLEKNTTNTLFSNPHVVLSDVFKFNEFRPQQIEIITRILNNEGNTLGIMPTGGGKTLCFQIPALIQSNLTIVVSPLIALMKDQVDNLRKKGVDSAFFINSSLNDSLKERILNLVEARKLKLLYIAPESLKSERILGVLEKIDIDLFVIDEAHCISTWGHDFRPDYLTLPKAIEKLNSPKILALTATATKKVEEDIQLQLNTKCKVFKSSFNRPNLYIETIQLADNVKKEMFLLGLLRKLKGQTIIFVTFTKTAETLSDFLNTNGLNSIFYHGRINEKEKEARQNQFMSGKCDIIVTTIAFGMGIDKSDIRNIIHYNISQSIESYYQEIGRAGRDYKKSNCITLLSQKDIKRLRDLISSGWPDRKSIENILYYLKSKESRYFFTTVRKISLDCKISDTPTKLILQKLEERGAIKIYSNVIYQINPVFSKNYEQIIRQTPEYTTKLSKIFSCSFFKNKRKSWLDFETIIEETKLNYFEIKEIFEYLRANGSLIYSKIEFKDLVLVKDVVNEIDITPLVNYFDQLLSSNLLKVELLTQTLTNDGCIRKNILRYFDESDLIDNCGMCSHCVTEKLTLRIEKKIDENYATDKEIKELKFIGIDYLNDTPLMILLKSLIVDKKISPNDFIKEFKKDLLKSTKFNPKFCESLEVDLIEEAIKKQLITREMDGTLRITKKGINFIVENGLEPKNSIDDFYEKNIEPKDDDLLKIDQTETVFNLDKNETAYVLIRCVAKLEHAVGKNLLAEILSGSKSKKIINLKLNESEYYNLLNKYSQNQILDMINQLIKDDYLGITQLTNCQFYRPVLIVTKKGRDAVTFKEDISLDLPKDNEILTVLEANIDESLYEMLKIFRTKVASEKQIPAYCVFDNKTLERIAHEKPLNSDDLIKIKGIGMSKLELYGEEIIKIVSSHSASNVVEYELKNNNKEDDSNISSKHSLNNTSEDNHFSMDHAETIDKIKKFFESMRYTTFLEYEVLDRGDGRHGFVDLVISNCEILVGVEVDRKRPRLKSVEKLKYFDIACFVLRSDNISEDSRVKSLERVLGLKNPFLLINIVNKEVVGYNLTADAIKFKDLFNLWVTNCL